MCSYHGTNDLTLLSFLSLCFFICALGITSHEGHTKRDILYTWDMTQSRHITNDGWLISFTWFLESKEHICLVPDSAWH